MCIGESRTGGLNGGGVLYSHAAGGAGGVAGPRSGGLPGGGGGAHPEWRGGGVLYSHPAVGGEGGVAAGRTGGLSGAGVLHIQCTMFTSQPIISPHTNRAGQRAQRRRKLS
jgi:hypothetical protein